MDLAVNVECEREQEIRDMESDMISLISKEEIEECHNSLKEVVEDAAVKPKLHCLMADPSFSMVTVQSEDSGIVWETASSKCSTPWASESHSPSEEYNLESSGTQGNIVIIMDEESIKKRKRTSSTKLGDMFKIASSRLPNSRIGEERLAMTEVSVPNLSSEILTKEASCVENKDQNLFRLISDGSEILNIVVPSKIPTEDEEYSIGLKENLSYLEDNTKIKSKLKQYDAVAPESCTGHTEISIQEIKQNESTHFEHSPSPILISDDTQSKKDECEMDYLEKFKLLDEQAPGDGTTLTEKHVQELIVQSEEPKLTQKYTTGENAFDDKAPVIGENHLEMSNEYLDDVFYGSSFNAECQEHDNQEKTTGETNKTLKQSGSALFGSQETILIPVFLPTGPPKIIDPCFLEEPRAMSFHYSDLYEDATGNRSKDNDFSDTESVVSEKSFKRRYSDSDDTEGYLEKFILKYETPLLANVSKAEEVVDEGEMIWSKNEFELPGCTKEEKDEATVSQSCVTDENFSKEQCMSTGCCLQGQCGTEMQPPMKMDIRKMTISENVAAEDATEFEKQCYLTDINKNSIITNSDPYDIQSQQTTITADIPVPRALESQDVIKSGIETISEIKNTGTMQHDAPHAVEKNDGSEDSVCRHQEVVDVMTEIQQKSNIIKESKGEYDEIKTQYNILETKLDAKADKDIIYAVEREAQDVTHFNEPLLDKAEDNSETMQPFMVEKSSGAGTTTCVSESECCLKSLKNNFNVHENIDVTARVEDKVIDNRKNEVTPLKEQQVNIVCFKHETGDRIGSEELLEENNIKLEPELRSTQTKSESTQSENDKTMVELHDKHEITSKDEILVTETEKIISSADERPKNIVIGEHGRPMKEVLLIKQSLEKQEQHTDIPEGESEVSNKVEKVQEINRDVTKEGKQEANTTKEILHDEIPSEDRISPALSTEMLDGGGEFELQKEHLNNAQTGPLEVHHVSPCSPVDEEKTPAMRVSALESDNSKKLNEDVDGCRSLRKANSILSKMPIFAPQEDISNFRFHPDFPEDVEMVKEKKVKQSEQSIAEDKEKVCGQVQLSDQTLEISHEFGDDLNYAQISEDENEEDIKIQPMDAFCRVCHCPVLLSDTEHQNHEIMSLNEAFDSLKEDLGKWISVLQERSEDIEDYVSELEMAYNTVEENFTDSKEILKEHNSEVVKLVMDQYNEMSQAMEEQKKAKLEQLYEQIVLFQENIDKAKETTEMTAKEMEESDPVEFLSISEDIKTRLNTALVSTMSLELGPRGLLVFEDCAIEKPVNERKNRQAIPVPKKPNLQPQEVNSATSTSVTVYWRANEDDIIDCFQVYCMEEPQGAISEEYRVTVKESYCNLEELEPDKCYKVWVMAVNYTGCSMPSERLPFKTAPSVPVIQTEQCTILWDSALLRWSAVQPSAVDSFTLEYCHQYACEREGLRSISGIKGYEQRVLLQPNENYLFYIKSVNAAGSSEQSEAALISTRGTRFHLLSETAHTELKVSEARNFVEYPDNTNKVLPITECQAVMGELLPSFGYYYWETVVSKSKAFRIGIAYKRGSQTNTLGDSNASWCLHCVPTSISCRFELLHISVESDIFVIDTPARIGTLLDYNQGRLFFFNAKNGQLLGTFQHTFTQPCHPVFALEQPGNLELKMTMEVPEFVKHS